MLDGVLFGTSRACDHFLHVSSTYPIQGGESGKESRPFDLAWARLMRDRCRAAGTAYFLKQLGDAAHEGGRPYRCRVRKGVNPAEWPDDLHVREWPARLTESVEQREVE
ncbi:MAG: DUF5131 family protein [Stellaceae bacterium]